MLVLMLIVGVGVGVRVGVGVGVARVVMMVKTMSYHHYTKMMMHRTFPFDTFLLTISCFSTVPIYKQAVSPAATSPDHFS